MNPVSRQRGLKRRRDLKFKQPCTARGWFGQHFGHIDRPASYLGPAETAGIEAAKAGTQLAQVSAQSTLDTVELDIAQAYLDLLSAQAALDAARLKSKRLPVNLSAPKSAWKSA